MNLQQRLCYAPDAADATGSTTIAVAPNKPVRLPRLPRKDADFAAVAARVADKWSATPAITLVWATAADFKKAADAFNATYGTRQAAASGRPAYTQALNALDAEVDKGVGRLKAYIQDKWEDKAAATAQYARYGIVYRDKGYELPRDRQQRLAALPLLLQALGADGFDSRSHGKAFWTDLHTRYAAALKAATDADSSVSTGVSAKNTLRSELAAIMEALQFVIRGNYPQSYEALYRAWGWQKEDY